MTEAVARITDLPEEDDIDLDLDAEDELLREAIGTPIRIKVGGKVVEIPHPTSWPYAANQASVRSDFDTWAAEVLSEDDCKIWQDAHLRNYQVNAVFDKINRRAGVSPGKSPSSRSSSRNKRRR